MKRPFLAMLLGLAVLGGTAVAAPTAQARPRVSHVVVVVMENQEYSSIIGNAQAPYLNTLATRKVLLTDDHAITHPSLPNYLALTGGSTFGITSDCTTCSVRGAGTNLIDQFMGRNISWKAYMETMPSACYTGATSGPFPQQYAKRHDPFAYFDDIASSARRCGHIVPYTRLATDLAQGALPTFAWVTPNVCDDMHSCSIATGDTWLSKNVPPILRGLGANGILIITWDEGSSNAGCCGVAAGGHIATIIAGPGAANHLRVSTPSDHYSVLQLIEWSLGLPFLRGARTAPPIRGWACHGPPC